MLPKARINGKPTPDSTPQLSAFFRVRQAGGAPCRNVRAAGAQVLDAIERQIAELVASRESIKETLKLWDQMLVKTPEGARAHLLECLPSGGGPLPAGRGRLVTKGSGNPAARPETNPRE